jgi:hypothetical protein
VNGKTQYQKLSSQKKKCQRTISKNNKKKRKNKVMMQEIHIKQYLSLEIRGKNMIKGNQYTNARRGKNSRKWSPGPDTRGLRENRRSSKGSCNTPRLSPC